jgi:predicted MFS family arabinose efflux permease
VALLAMVQLLYAPFSSARNAVLPAILSGDRFVAGLALVRTTNQLGMVIGFGAGGALATALGTHTTLLIDAATFAVSALLVGFGVRAHRPPQGDGPVTSAARAWWTSVRDGFALVSTDRKLRALVALACTSGFYVVPEGIAVPYANQIHGNATAVGLLLAANPIGAVIGMVALQRVRPDWRVRLMGPLAVATCLVLLPTALAPVLAISMLLWIANGLFSAYDMVTNATFVQLTPDASRGQAIGLASAAMQGAQGLGVVLAGLLAQTLAPGTVVGLAAVLGSIAALLAAVAWTHADRGASRIAIPGDA